MNEKEGRLQLELFSPQQKTFGGTKPSMQNKFIFRQIKSHEKTILIIVAMVITGIFSFSLGVEKGKKFVQRVPSHPVENKSDSPMLIPQVLSQPKIDKKEPIKPTATQDKWQYYTIQLASYQNKALAQKEAEALKKKGFSPLVSSKGGYTVLCLGNFPDKKKALSLLSELKKRYRDCFIRRL